MKIEIFQLKNFDLFLIFTQNIGFGYKLQLPYSGAYNKYPQSTFKVKIRKIVLPCKLHFHHIKVGCEGVFITQTCLHDESVKQALCIIHVLCKRVQLSSTVTEKLCFPA